ncbi:MAG TPA: M56 family metallopeptidase [Verrucomicrobiales bacterium]|nr:M56 family metallopeptidase [Verrucomicrobiales bacterium]
MISLLLLPFMAGTLPTWQVPGFFFSDTNSSEIPTDGTVIVSRPITVGITATDVESNLSQNLEIRDERVTADRILFEEARVGIWNWNSLFLVLSGIWFSGTLFFSASLLLSVRRVIRLESVSNEITEDSWTPLIRKVCRELGMKRKIRFLTGPHGTVPMTWGWLRPVIFLPSESSHWSSAKRLNVLRHELAHVVRGDCVIQVLAGIVSAVYWMNPLVWSISKRLRLEQERACDDRVLSSGSTAQDYADCLIEMVREFQSVPVNRSAGFAMARASQLEPRLKSILEVGRVRKPIGLWAKGLIASVILAIAGVSSAIHVSPDPEEAEVTQSEFSTKTTQNPGVEPLPNFLPGPVSIERFESSEQNSSLITRFFDMDLATTLRFFEEEIRLNPNYKIAEFPPNEARDLLVETIRLLRDESENGEGLFISGLGKLMIRSTPDKLNTLEKLFREMKSTTEQIRVEARIFESTEFIEIPIEFHKTILDSSKPPIANLAVDPPIDRKRGFLSASEVEKIYRQFEQIETTFPLGPLRVTTLSGRKAQLLLSENDTLSTHDSELNQLSEINGNEEEIEIELTIRPRATVFRGLSILMDYSGSFSFSKDAHEKTDIKNALSDPSAIEDFKKKRTVRVKDGHTMWINGFRRIDAQGNNKYIDIFITPTVIDPAGNRKYVDESGDLEL